MRSYYCTACQSTFQLTGDVQQGMNCLFCGHKAFSDGISMANQDMNSSDYELIIPFEVDQSLAEEKIEQFILRNKWFSPADLGMKNGLKRLRPYFIPIWLTDVEIRMKWEAELAFPATTLSAIDTVDQTGVKRKEISKTFLRWQEFGGEVQESFENLRELAVDNDDDWLMEQLAFSLDDAVLFQPDLVQDSIVCQPHPLSPMNKLNIYKQIINSIEERIVEASDAKSIKNFDYQSETEKSNLTQLLIPLFATHFYDAKGLRHVVVVNGRTGELYGKAIRSMFWSVWLRLLLFINGLGVLILLNNLPQNAILDPDGFTHFLLSCAVFVGFVILPFFYLYSGVMAMFEHNKFEIRL